MDDWLRYSNQSATRNLPISPELAAAMGFLPELGLTMEVYSGGQPGKGESDKRVGSTRHDHGGAADVMFYDATGRMLDWNNPNDLATFEQIVQRAKAAGVTGIGAGDDYMGPGRMHIGFGNPSVWGAGGKSANAPEWLVSAYGGAPAGSAPIISGAPSYGGNALATGQGGQTMPQNQLAAPERPQPPMMANALDPRAFAQAARMNYTPI